MVPGYGTPSTAQRQTLVMHMDWRSCVVEGACTDAGQDYHNACKASAHTFGTFQKDSNCCVVEVLRGAAALADTEVTSLASVAIAGGICPRNYGSGDNFTRCISAFGSAYANQNSETVTGHWWGHGQSHLLINLIMAARPAVDF
jgi:hypothetical protein